MNLIQSKQKLARFVAVVILFIIICSGVYTMYASVQGKYDKWVTTNEGIVSTKIVKDGRAYLEINKEFVYVNSKVYAEAKEGSEITLGHEEDTLSIFRVFHALISSAIAFCCTVALVGIFLNWLFNYSDSISFITFLRKGGD